MRFSSYKIVRLPALSLAAILVLNGCGSKSENTAATTPAPAAAPAPEAAAAVPPVAAPVPAPAPAAVATAPAPAPLPKLDVFPTPQPLSSEEQALVHFVTHTPSSELQAMQKPTQEQDEPLHIAEIVIQPIASPDKSDTQPNR